MKPSLYVSLVWYFGMLAIFVGERMIGTDTKRGMASGLGLALVVAAIVWRGLRMSKAETERKRIERVLLGLGCLGLASVLFYFAQSDAVTLVTTKTLDREFPKLATALAALWPALWIAAALPTLLVEMSYAAVARAPRLETGRIRDAMYSGLGLAGAFVFVFAGYYVSSERDKKVDLSYFRTARPGEATRNIVKAFDKPVEVSLFFPPANEVREQVAEYFNDLAAQTTLLTVKSYDQALEPAKAKELGVSGNGTIAFSRGGAKELLSIGTVLESSRGQLRNLDKEAQKRFLKVAKGARIIYFVAGHSERTHDTTADTDKRGTIRDLREALQQQNYSLRALGAAEGLAADVPNDAAAVLVIGPQKPMLVEEVAALKRYFERGGRLFLALDPEAGLDEKEVLEPLGLKFNPVRLANDAVYARKSYQNSDRSNIATGTFSSHPSVTTLSKMGQRAPVILPGAGWLEAAKDKPKELSTDFTLRAHAATWNDLNGNFTFDSPAEMRKAWELAAAVVRKPPAGADGKVDASKESRAIVLADSDALSDGVIGNPGNAYFVIDGLKWLLGDEALQGETNTEADAPIQHTRKQDVAWFYASIFLAPAAILGAGMFATRRRRAARPSKTKESE